MTIPVLQSPPKPKRVLIIGGGATGLVALRNLLERGHFDHVELVERRDDIGGVWYLDNPETSSDSKGIPRWPSPAYPGLIGNVLPKNLSFSLYPFAPPPSSPTQPYPNLTETHEYLRGFAQRFIDNGKIKLGIEVLSVDELPERTGWKVSLKDWNKGSITEEVWDAVVLATGFYDHPVWPETEGLDKAREKGLAKHAKWWRGPLGYEGKRILVVGNGNSANDMAAQLVRVAVKPVHRSIRHPASPRCPSLPDPNIIDVAPITRYTVEGDKLAVELKDGTTIRDLDYVFIGAGYRAIPSFVHVRQHDSNSEKLVPLATPSTHPPRIPSLYRHILYAYNPTLAFIGAVVSYTPFTLADLSSTWLTLAWNGEVVYPDNPEGLLVYEKERLERVRLLREGVEAPSSFVSFHFLDQEEQGYALALRKDVVGARSELGTVLADWDDESWNEREQSYAKKYEALKVAKDLELEKLKSN